MLRHRIGCLRTPRAPFPGHPMHQVVQRKGSAVADLLLSLFLLCAFSFFCLPFFVCEKRVLLGTLCFFPPTVSRGRAEAAVSISRIHQV